MAEIYINRTLTLILTLLRRCNAIFWSVECKSLSFYYFVRTLHDRTFMSHCSKVSDSVFLSFNQTGFGFICIEPFKLARYALDYSSMAVMLALTRRAC